MSSTDCKKEREKKEPENNFSDEAGELRIGLTVASTEDAYELYNTYAFWKGFSVRRRHKRYDSTGNITQICFSCSKEGESRADPQSEGKSKKASRLITRTGCKAEVRFKLDNDLWKICYFSAEHNHELANRAERQFLRSGRKILDAHADLVASVVAEATTRPSKASILAKKVGDNSDEVVAGNQNFLQRDNMEGLDAADVQSLIDHFKKKQAEDPMFFYTVQLDHAGRLTNLFWRDGRSRLDYNCFGDVVVFDTTFRESKYNLVCAPFFGINHHCGFILFGCALLLDDTADSFVWLFRTYMESMGSQAPKTILTDHGPEIADAISMVLPDSRHNMCLRLIRKNASLHIGHFYTNKDFVEMFNKCVVGCHTEEEFQETWDEMLRRFDCIDNSWLNKLYESREKWCTAFCLDTFSAGLRSSPRSEIGSVLFNKVTDRTVPLTHFVKQYEAKAKKLRYEELREDFRCKNGLPPLMVKGGMLYHAACYYTLVIFKEFEKEFYKCMAVRLTEIGYQDGVYTYQSFEEDCTDMYTVEYAAETSKVYCSCKLFESKGILCSHALKVLDRMNWMKLPSEYILKRWTRDAKKGVTLGTSTELSTNSGKSSMIRFSELMYASQNVFNLASKTERGTQIVKEKLDDALNILEKEIDVLTLEEENNELNDVAAYEKSIDVTRILDRSRKRVKTSTDNRKRKVTENEILSQRPTESEYDEQEPIDINSVGVHQSQQCQASQAIDTLGLQRSQQCQVSLRTGNCAVQPSQQAEVFQHTDIPVGVVLLQGPSLRKVALQRPSVSKVGSLRPLISKAALQRPPFYQVPWVFGHPNYCVTTLPQSSVAMPDPNQHSTTNQMPYALHGSTFPVLDNSKEK